MFIVYIMRSLSTGNLYIGQTEDLPRRLTEHRTGLGRYTRRRGPWQLVYQEEYTTRSEAMKREKALKSGQGREWLKGELDSKARLPEAD
jgi:putative endonuclease